MAPNDRRVIVRIALAAVLLSAVGLSGCGRNGPLEPPPKADVSTTDKNADPANSGKSDRNFPLDFLL